MFSKTVTERARGAVLGAVFSATAIGVYAYLTPSDAAVVVPDSRPEIASQPAIEPWSDFLSKDAVEANGIELNLDGNASALFPSDEFRASR